MRPNVNVTVGGPKNPSEYTYKNVVLKSNLPFAAQVGEPNCIFVIRWDFDLKGESVVIPKNCVLNFEGGSVRNGTIIPDYTAVTNSGNGVIFKDVTIYNNGKISKQKVSVDWFANSGGNDYINFINAILLSGYVEFTGQKEYCFNKVENFSIFNGGGQSHYELAPAYCKIEGNSCTWNIGENALAGNYIILLPINGHLEANNINIEYNVENAGTDRAFRVFGTTELLDEDSEIILNSIHCNVNKHNNCFVALAQLYAGRKMYANNCSVETKYKSGQIFPDTGAGMGGGFIWIQHISNNTCEVHIENCIARCHNSDEIISLYNQDLKQKDIDDYFGGHFDTSNKNIVARYLNSVFEYLGDSSEIQDRTPMFKGSPDGKVECVMRNCQFINNIQDSGERNIDAQLVNLVGGGNYKFNDCTFKSLAVHEAYILNGNLVPAGYNIALFHVGEDVDIEFNGCTLYGNYFITKDGWSVNGRETQNVKYNNCLIHAYGLTSMMNYSIRAENITLAYEFSNCKIELVSPMITPQMSYILKNNEIFVSSGYNSLVYCLDFSLDPTKADFIFENNIVNGIAVQNYNIDRILLLGTQYRFQYGQFPIYNIGSGLMCLIPFVLDSEIGGVSTPFTLTRYVFYNSKHTEEGDTITLKIPSVGAEFISVSPGGYEVIETYSAPSQYYYLYNTKNRKKFQGIIRAYDDLENEVILETFVNTQTSSLPVGHTIHYGTTPIWWDGENYRRADGAVYTAYNHGSRAARLQLNPEWLYVGFQYMQVDAAGTFPLTVSNITRTGEGTEQDPYVYEVTWSKPDGSLADTPMFGAYADKPTIADYNIPIGFHYLCNDLIVDTDDSSPTFMRVIASAGGGLEIIHKGSDVWVDALGRVVE